MSTVHSITTIYTAKKSTPFALKISMGTKAPKALVIGSHLYYPKTFSGALTSRLALAFADTRAFAAYDARHQEGDFALDHLVNDVEAIRMHLGMEKMILVGHSVHAFLALEYARRFPHCVSHVVLIASSPITGPTLYAKADQYFQDSVCLERKAAFARTLHQWTESGDASFVARMMAFGPRLWYDFDFEARPLWDGVHVHSLGSGQVWGSMFLDYPMAQALQGVQCPVFLALGRYDYFNPPYLWQDVRAHAKDLTIRVFEKSGHTPQLEQADLFDHELLSWLHTHTP